MHPSPMAAYPPAVTSQQGGRLAEVIKDWCIAHGLTVRPPPAVLASEADPHNLLATAVPVSLFPSPFPRLCFDQGVAVQRTYNQLYASISQDEAFLGHIVSEIGDSDEFITELWKVHLRVKQEGYKQDLSLGLFRSDYMVHQDGSGSPPVIKQVEFNTIASSFGGLSSQTCLLHEYLSRTEYPLLEEPIKAGSLNLPPNSSTKDLASGIVAAFVNYGPSITGHDKCVIFLVQGGERNMFDQRHLEYELQAAEDPRIPVFRLPFGETLQRTRLSSGRQLLYRPAHLVGQTFEVAVVYMRCGYGPADYSDQSAWEARYHIERSAAIKCPSVLTQIAGTKKVQQVLATPTDPSSAAGSPILQHFLAQGSTEDGHAMHHLSSTFTNIYPLDASPAGLEARKLALDAVKCKAYVLKPQREGGGNNIYRTAIPPFLRSVPEGHWGAYILMELITPPAVHNTILRNGQLEQGGVICELGIYGTCLWRQREGHHEMLWNEQAGYLLRTKGDQSEEGGVAAGFGCMDSCALV